MRIDKLYLKHLAVVVIGTLLIVLTPNSQARQDNAPEQPRLVTLHLQRATAIRILNVGLDRDSRNEVVGALKGERREGKLEAVIITADDAAEWAERLRDNQTVDPLLAKRLEGAFALALGTFVEPDRRWTFRE